MLKSIKAIIDRIMGRQSVRGSAMVAVGFGLLGKGLGYGRVLVIAWLFGATGVVDSFNVALGIMTLFATTISLVLESALLPIMIREPREKSVRLFQVIWRVISVFTLVFLFLSAFFSRDIVYIFARNFDLYRLETAARMLIYFTPWAFITIQQAFFNIWASFCGRYNVVGSIANFWNLIAIPVLLLSRQSWGAYALPASFSIALLFVLLQIWWVLRDAPFFTRCVKFNITKTLKHFSHDAILCIGIAGSNVFFQAIDRYFGSSLPGGNIAAMGYAAIIYSLPMQLIAPIFFIFLAKASEKIDKKTADERLCVALGVAWVYLFPVGCFISALAPTIVKLLLGHGAFSATAVNLTALCVSVSAPIIPLCAWQTILYKQAQAQNKLALIVWISYGGIVANGILDWLVLSWWGAPGLCFATSITWAATAIAYLRILRPAGLWQLLAKCFKPSIIALLCSGVVYSLSLYLSPILLLLTSVLTAAVYYLGGDRRGWFSFIPIAWQPRELISLMPLLRSQRKILR